MVLYLKKIVIIILVLNALSLKSQNPWYWGGNFSLGLGDGTFNVNLTPELTKSISRVLDMGFALNFGYLKNSNSNFEYQKISYGMAVISRLWIAQHVVISLNPEYNWLHVTTKDPSTQLQIKTFAQAPSILVGVGYGSRDIGDKVFFVSVLLDILNDPNSPYYTGGVKLPFFRAGFGLYLGR